MYVMPELNMTMRAGTGFAPAAPGRDLIRVGRVSEPI